MRALVFRGADGMRVEQIAVPAPGPGDVLVDVVAVGICGSDVHGFAGETGRRSAGMVMGHEISGVVVEVGAAVHGWSVGDRVVVNPVIGCRSCAACAIGATNRCPRRQVIGVAPNVIGGFAQRIAVPAGNLVAFDTTHGRAVDGSLVEPLAVALNAVRRARVSDGDCVAVVGLGMIGLGCVWAAAREGAAVIYAGDVDPARVALARRIAPDVQLVGFDLRDRPLHEQLMSHQVPPPDRAIDAVGLAITCRDAMRCVRPGGVVCLVGMGAPELELDAYELSTNEKSLVGSFCYTEQVFAECADALAAGRLDSSLFVDDVVVLEQAPRVFTDLATRARNSVKTVVLPQG